MQKTKPLKRAEPLRVLSREHHTILQFCFSLRQSEKQKADLKVIQMNILRFYHEFFEPHSKRELEVLQSLSLGSPEIKIYTEKHKKLAALTKTDIKNYSQLLDFERFLEQTIRWEERQLFEFLQQNFSLFSIKSACEKLKSELSCPVGVSYFEA
jgi:hypothetical protein